MKGQTNLWIAHIDSRQATEEYKENILVEARKKFDDQRVLAIEEELNSPCTEEMATFEKFIEFATLKEFEVIIFDTAPTGHTLKLLELPVDWNRQIEIKTFTSTGETEVDKITKSRFKEVIDMMQDIHQTTFSFVMYPESTPIEEASRAMEELLTIGVPTSLVVANFILPESIITNDFLKQRKEMQDAYLTKMDIRFTAPIVTLPLLKDDLIGKEKLEEAGYLLYGK
jgi:arsenite-transporting ATPase